MCYIDSSQTYVLHYVLCICVCICICVLCDFDVCTYRFNEFASFCRRLIKSHSEKTVALPPKPKPNSNLTCKTESTRVPVYVCVGRERESVCDGEHKTKQRPNGATK